jgi:hypothetical protein
MKTMKLNTLKAKVFLVSFLFVGASLISIQAQEEVDGSVEAPLEISEEQGGGESGGQGGSSMQSKRMAINPRVAAIRDQMEALAVQVSKMQHTGDIGQLRLADLAALKKANYKLDKQIEELSNSYLGVKPRRLIKPIRGEKVVEGETEQDCQIDSSQRVANCDGETYRRVEEKVLGEVDLSEGFENFVTDIPRHTTEESFEEESSVFVSPGTVGAR